MEGTRFIRKFTEEERTKFVKEALEYGSVVMVAKKYSLHQSLLSRWISNYRRYGQTLEPKEPKEKTIIPNYKKEYKKIMKKNRELELQVAILEDLLKKKTQH